MKHSDWLRLNSEGDTLARFLAEKGYRVAKKKSILSWTFSGLGKSYSFIFLPRPVGDWALLPNDLSAEYYELNQLIKQLKLHRGVGR